MVRLYVKQEIIKLIHDNRLVSGKSFDGFSPDLILKRSRILEIHSTDTEKGLFLRSYDVVFRNGSVMTVNVSPGDTVDSRYKLYSYGGRKNRITDHISRVVIPIFNYECGKLDSLYT